MYTVIRNAYMAAGVRVYGCFSERKYAAAYCARKRKASRKAGWGGGDWRVVKIRDAR